MGRIYTIPFRAVAVTAAQDLFEALAAAGKPFYVNSIVIGQYSDPGDAQAELLSVVLKRATSGYTTGSGGSSATVGKGSTNDTAAAVTAKANNTTIAIVGTGTLVELMADVWNVQAGYTYYPQREDRFLFLPAEAAIFTLPGAPLDSLTTNGTMTIEEL